MSWRRALLPFTFLLGGCAVGPTLPEPVLPFTPAQHPGVWIAEGYGYVLDVKREAVHVYHWAGGTCVEDVVDGAKALDFYDRYRSVDGGRTLLLSSTLDPYVVRFRATDRLPAPCATRVPNNPPANFSAFADYFSKHYAFFDLHGVDWPARVASARDGIDNSTSDGELFERMRRAVMPLRDSHVKIEARIAGKRVKHDGDPGATSAAVAAWGAREGLSAAEAQSRFRRAYWVDDIRRELLDGKGRMAGNGRIQYGLVAPGVGYIAFASMGGFIDGEFATRMREVPVLDAAMEDAMALFTAQGVRAVILDVAFNTGGLDFVALAIAGRFAAAPALAYTRRAFDAPGSDAFPVFVQPASGARFTGPVYLLTSDVSASATEILTLGLRALGNVTHAGGRTRGAFSTALEKPLPNGWNITLSNEIYTDPRGIVWEGRGIEPQVPLTVFNPDNPLQGHVEAVRTLVRGIKP